MTINKKNKQSFKWLYCNGSIYVDNDFELRDDISLTSFVMGTQWYNS